MKEEKIPLIFWHSDPVKPDETLVLSGEDLAGNAVVEFSEQKNKWLAGVTLQQTPQSLKAVVPAALKPGTWTCRVKQGKNVSREFVVNAPDVWWKQGEGGMETAWSGSWLRIFGKCLNITGKSKIRIGSTEIICTESDCFALRAEVPEKIKAGSYPLEIFNGSIWGSGGNVEINMRKPDTRPVLDIMNTPGMDPTGMKDCTLPFVQTLEFARGLGGAIIQLPRGRFRIDGILRPGTYMDSQLFLPENTTLRGAGPNETSLWWPDKKRGFAGID